MKGIRVAARSAFDIERYAYAVRRVLLPDTTDNDPIDGSRLFNFVLEERGPGLVRGATVQVNVEELPRSIEAYTQFISDADGYRITLSERTCRRLENGESRELFTLCHEIGHLCLHGATLKGLGQLPHRELMLARGQPTHKIFRDSEWQADRFAAAFLMPAPGLERLRASGRLNEDEVASRYLTSYEAAGYRINDFNAKGELLLRAWGKS